MNIAILGYGRMGKEIERIALERNHKILLTIDIGNQADLTPENLSSIDVAIDFSIPESAWSNIMRCFDANTPVVSGTTGWLDKFDNVISICKEKGQTFFYASNYSLGVNIFFQLNRKLAGMMNSFSDYDISIEEIHHTQKLDAPSGTAIKLAGDIISVLDRKTRWELNKASERDSIEITAIRKENITGIHTITYDSPMDYIEIKHSAKSRKGFALGAILAAEFIKDKKGYFTMNDLLQLS
ncbi:MAG: 4-hydroxy-tetrahydrodipicolinate reductase [Bacteroidales bacterium]|nr:MAG: 4-hydroxy-tetrahydrodipicolinate reductase [Bacteroidales bacterium]